VTDLDILYRAMLLDPWDDLARMACCDEYEMVTGSKPDLLTEWSGPLAEFTGTAEALFRQHPIREVRFTDKSPLSNYGVQSYLGGSPISPGTQWYWFGSASPKMRWSIPAAFKMQTDPFSSAEDAWSALSAAAVNYGRSLAGLPPLPIPASATS
jgi:hypothetical protein